MNMIKVQVLAISYMQYIVFFSFLIVASIGTDTKLEEGDKSVFKEIMDTNRVVHWYQTHFSEDGTYYCWKHSLYEDVRKCDQATAPTDSSLMSEYSSVQQ